MTDNKQHHTPSFKITVERGGMEYSQAYTEFLDVATSLARDIASEHQNHWDCQRPVVRVWQLVEELK
jgi:hypothetical protein